MTTHDDALPAISDDEIRELWPAARGMMVNGDMLFARRVEQRVRDALAARGGAGQCPHIRSTGSINGPTTEYCVFNEGACSTREPVSEGPPGATTSLADGLTRPADPVTLTPDGRRKGQWPPKPAPAPLVPRLRDTSDDMQVAWNRHRLMLCFGRGPWTEWREPVCMLIANGKIEEWFDLPESWRKHGAPPALPAEAREAIERVIAEIAARIERAINAPAETMSNGKAVAEMLRELRLMRADLNALRAALSQGEAGR